MRRFLAEPLFHFIVVGGLLYCLYEWVGPGPAVDPANIVVDERTLVTFMLGRQPRLTPDAARDAIAAMTPADRDALVAAYLREEVLVREARSLGLGEADRAVRRRLVSQLEFVNEGFLKENLEFTDAELKSFFDAHPELFREPAQITFTHVFFDGNRRADDSNAAMAYATLEELKASTVPFHQSMQYGDRFFFQPNYVRRSQDEIVSHFGERFGMRLFELEVSEAWRGPLQSDHGYHLVLVAAKEPAFLPPLDEVRTRVREYLLAERLAEARDAFYETARSNYNVILNLPAGSAPP